MHLPLTVSALILAFSGSDDLVFVEQAHLPRCEASNVFVQSEGDVLSVSLTKPAAAEKETVPQKIRDWINKATASSKLISPTTFSNLGSYGEGFIVSVRSSIAVSGTYWVPTEGDPVRISEHSRATLVEGHGKSWLLSGRGTFIPGPGVIRQIVDIQGEPVLGDIYPLPLEPTAHAVTDGGFVVATAMGPVDIYLSGITRHVAFGYPPTAAGTVLQHFEFPTSVTKYDGRIFIGGQGGYAEYKFVDEGYSVQYFGLDRCEKKL